MATLRQATKLKIQLKATIQELKSLEDSVHQVENPSSNQLIYSKALSLKKKLKKYLKKIKNIPKETLKNQNSRKKRQRILQKENAKIKKHRENLNKIVQIPSNKPTTSSTTSPSLANPKEVPSQLDLDINKKAKSFLNFFDLLKSLRYARCQDEVASQEFAEKFYHLTFIWENMLQASKPHHFNQMKLEDQWNQIFFGVKKSLREGEPKSTKDFLQIRRIWDSYIINTEHSGGSCIPKGWVLPKSNASELWSAFRF